MSVFHAQNGPGAGHRIILFVKNSVFRLISLLVMAVAASLDSVSRRLASSVLMAISLILLTARCDALLRPLIII